MKRLLRIVSLVALLTAGGAIGAGAFFIVEKSPRFTVSVVYQTSPELGEELVVRYPSGTTEAAAKASFNIFPSMDGQLVWLNERRELHFLPALGFSPAVAYTVNVRTPGSFFATAGTTKKSYSFQPAGAQKTYAAYTPEYLTGKYIDINLRTMRVTLFENGVPVKTVPVAGKGHPAIGRTPEGKFKVQSKEEKHRSTLSGVWMPWSMRIGGPYFVHGWPYFSNGEKVKVAYSQGCVRLADGDDKFVYDWADIGTPVVIHSSAQAVLHNETTIADGDLVREFSRPEVYLIKTSDGAKFKRHILSADIAKWYPHLSPFESRIKTVPDGTLGAYFTSRWIRPDTANTVFEIDAAGIKHPMRCNGIFDSCFTVWELFGWNSAEIYTVNNLELETYPTGEPLDLPLSSSIAQ